MPIIVATFYHFFDFPHYATLRDPLLARMQELRIKGSVLIASEGINSTISGTRAAIDAFLLYLEQEVVKEAIEHKESMHEIPPFKRARVRLKKETISIGEPVAMDYTGKYVNAVEWNTLLEDPDTIVIDSRNQYETHLGTFAGAIDPKIDTFKQLPDFIRREMLGTKDRKIATFCTGGIRCEKFTSWLMEQGFTQVYHLKGGILKYFEEMPQQQSKWQGECYVFDERVAVDHNLNASMTAMHCPICDQTLTKEEQMHPDYRVSEQCQHCSSNPKVSASHAPLKTVP